MLHPRACRRIKGDRLKLTWLLMRPRDSRLLFRGKTPFNRTELFAPFASAPVLCAAAELLWGLPLPAGARMGISCLDCFSASWPRRSCSAAADAAVSLPAYRSTMKAVT